MDIRYEFARICSYFSKDRRKYMSKYFRKMGMNIGENCNITSNIRTSEPYLVSIGDNVTISEDVLLLTHDASIGKIFGKEIFSDLVGEIKIGNNCFIGARVIILCGVSLADNTIVAAGSVVTSSVNDSKMVIGGVPAKVISNWECLKEKSKLYAFSLHNKKGNKAKKIILGAPEKLIKK